MEDPTKESRIDEDFTPLIEQDGYEQDYNYMSGGERTSLALAYRLSLNTIVQKVSAGIKSNLLILDEPTDGFSKEQLFKIREILDELKCPQVIARAIMRQIVHRLRTFGGLSKDVDVYLRLREAVPTVST